MWIHHSVLSILLPKQKKFDRYDFMFFDFQTKTPVSLILYACLYLNSMICVDNPKERLKTQFFCQLSEIFV